MRLGRIGLAVALLAGTMGGLQEAVGYDVVRPAATVQVSITEFQFSPKRLKVHLGDTVVWKNNGTMIHTSTANNAMWDSGSINPGGSFSFTFNVTGTVPYHCTVHPTLMTGLVRVIP